MYVELFRLLKEVKNWGMLRSHDRMLESDWLSEKIALITYAEVAAILKIRLTSWFQT